MSILKKIVEKPDHLTADDDHLDRKDITEKEFEQACKELKEKHGTKKQKKKPNE